jgi:hypothetical protein
MKQCSTVSEQTLSENCRWCLDWIVLCGFTSLQMCLLWKFSMQFLVRLAWSLKGTQLLKKDSSPHCQRNHWQKSGVSKQSTGLRACTHCKCYGHNNPPQSRACHMHGSLHSTNYGMGILLYMSQYVPFHINCLCTSLSSAVYCKRANSTGIPEAMINGVKDAWVQKSTLRIPFHVQLYSCFTITMWFKKN